MIGHFGHPPTVEWLRSRDPVHMFDTVGQAEPVATAQACDIGLIPHRQQAGIRAMSPLKLYEYLAAGLPVVSVDLPSVHGVDDDRVLIVDQRIRNPRLLEPSPLATRPRNTGFGSWPARPESDGCAQ